MVSFCLWLSCGPEHASVQQRVCAVGSEQSSDFLCVCVGVVYVCVVYVCVCGMCMWCMCVCVCLCACERETRQTSGRMFEPADCEELPHK